MLRSAVIGVAASNLAVMEKSGHTPASLLLPGKSQNTSSKALCKPLTPLSSPLLLQRAAGGAQETQHRGRDAAGTPKIRCTQIV